MNLFCCFVLMILFGVSSAQARFGVSLEGGVAGYSRNVARIPGDSGDTVDLASFDRSPIFAWRIMPSYRFSMHHEIRGLWAPLLFTASGEFNDATDYFEETFPPDVATQASYKFNSYRLAYIYHVNPEARMKWRIGFVAKIRDAYIRLEQENLVSTKSNLGFVPLLHVGFDYRFSDSMRIDVDVDASGAPQGRAIDLLASLRYMIPADYFDHFFGYVGYRTVEGGADVKEVYNFAWIHQGVVGLEVQF